MDRLDRIAFRAIAGLLAIAICLVLTMAGVIFAPTAEEIRGMFPARVPDTATPERVNRYPTVLPVPATNTPVIEVVPTVEAVEAGPAEATVAPTASSVTAFNGNGGAVRNFTSEGVFVVTSSHSGTGFFGIRLLNQAGQLEDVLANCIGVCRDETVVRLGQGRYLIEIDANGAWEMRFERQ